MITSCVTTLRFNIFDSGRSQVVLNYGFVKQLHAFALCSYEPCKTNPAYISWKRRQMQDVRGYLNKLSDTTPIVPDQLFMTRRVEFGCTNPKPDCFATSLSDFPRDPTQAESLLLEFGITHDFSISPAQPSAAAICSVKHHHINISDRNKDALLLALADICKEISDAISEGGLVLVHSLVESKAYIVVCAYRT